MERALLAVVAATFGVASGRYHQTPPAAESGSDAWSSCTSCGDSGDGLYYVADEIASGHAVVAATGLNDLGVVVGRQDSPHPLAFSWSTRSGFMLLSPGSATQEREFPCAVSNCGLVVGFSRSSSGICRGRVWARGRPINVGSLGGPFTELLGVNSLGESVGVSEDENGLMHAVTWSARSGLRPLMRPLAQGSKTYVNVGPIGRAVNDHGDVVGCGSVRDPGFYLANGRCAAIRGYALAKRGSCRFRFGAQPGAVTASLNNAGTVVGTMLGPDARDRAFVWNRSTGPRSLAEPSGALASVANVISATGLIAGHVSVGTLDNSLACLWIPDGRCLKLTPRTRRLPPSVLLRSAIAINKRAQVLASASNGRYYLLSPVHARASDKLRMKRA